ncbi:hypothetical protein FB451DRAFT_1167847 [Mycena latifolia]|nr:hypothetical protein FB451DRAFT_1167847 [Mycena latifolia]
MEASLTASKIYDSVSEFKGHLDWIPQVRNIPLGDINLLEHIAGTSQRVGIYTARIYGEPSKMTVVKYEDERANQTPKHMATVWSIECSRFAYIDIPRWPSSDLAYAYLEATLVARPGPLQCMARLFRGYITGS